MKALAVIVLLRRSWFDKYRLGADRSDPGAHFLGDELIAIGPYEIGRAPQDEQVCQGINHVGRVEFAFDTDHQRLLRELIDNFEGAKQPPVMRPVLHEII